MEQDRGCPVGTLFKACRSINTLGTTSLDKLFTLVVLDASLYAPPTKQQSGRRQASPLNRCGADSGAHAHQVMLNVPPRPSIPAAAKDILRALHPLGSTTKSLFVPAPFPHQASRLRRSAAQPGFIFHRTTSLFQTRNLFDSPRTMALSSCLAYKPVPEHYAHPALASTTRLA